MNKNYLNRQKRPDKVTIICENNGKEIVADVLTLNERLLVAAIAGVKVTLISSKENGIYSGRMGGLELLYKN